MSFEWSFSGERLFNRCQRQFYFREFVAHHSGKNPLRRECFVLKQLKSLEQWQGDLVHLGIEKFVVPALRTSDMPNWDRVIAETVKIAERQRAFSRARRYRDASLPKTKVGDDYYALLVSEEDRDITVTEWDEVTGTIERALRNLASLDMLWTTIGRRGTYLSEMFMHLNYDGAHIVVKPDLVCYRSGKPIVVDWKVSESMGGSDARTQMGVYAWAMTQCSQRRIERMEDAELIEVQLLKPAVITHACDESLVLEIENRVYRSIQEIRALCGDGNFKTLDPNDFELARNANSCAFCQFRKVCAESLVKDADAPISAESPEDMTDDAQAALALFEGCV